MLRSIKPLNRLFFLAAVVSTIACASALAACSSTVTCEGAACENFAGGGGGSSSSSGGGGRTGGDAGHVQMTAVMFGTDPITLRVTSFPVACGNPTQDAPFDQCDWSTMQVSFPADMLVAGGSVDLANPAVNIFFQFAGTPNSPAPADCPGTGGGGQLPGTVINFVSVDAASAVVDVGGFDDYLIGGEGINGTYTASRCP